MVKKLLFGLVLLLLGVAVGGGAAYGVGMLLAPPRPAEAHAEPTAFVPVPDVLAPIVFHDTRLAGYVRFSFSIEVDQSKEAEVTEHIPLLLHAINMRTYKTPMVSGTDGTLPDISVFRRIVEQAATEALGTNVVKRVAITKVDPA